MFFSQLNQNALQEILRKYKFFFLESPEMYVQKIYLIKIGAKKVQYFFLVNPWFMEALAPKPHTGGFASRPWTLLDWIPLVNWNTGSYISGITGEHFWIRFAKILKFKLET